MRFHILFVFETWSHVAQRMNNGSPGRVASIDQGTPRPKSEQWLLKARQKPAPAVRQTGGQSHNPVPQKGKCKGQSKDAGPPVQSPRGSKPDFNPDEQFKAAQVREVKFEGSNCGDWRRGGSHHSTCAGRVASSARSDCTPKLSWTVPGRRWRH